MVIDWMDKNKPDVLCVQETKVQDDDFPEPVFDKAGYNCAFKGQKKYNGVAVFSTSAISNVETGLPGEPPDHARLIKAEILGINIVNTYVPQGYLADTEKFEYKLNWLRRLKKYFKNTCKPAKPVIWTGDLNIAPEPADVYDPELLGNHVCFHPLARNELKSICNWGFTDVFRMHCSEAGRYTFWDYRPPGAFKRNRGWRLDHIMATKPLAEKCTDCQIDTKPRTADRPSDHTPVLAEFDW